MKTLVALLIAIVASQAQACLYQVKVEKSQVYDGDTIQNVLISLKDFNTTFKRTIRLSGIDAPEIRTKDLAEKKLGFKARDWLRALIAGQNIQLQIEGREKYGRSLGTIFLNGENVNELMVKKGLAKRYEP